ncbi:MAG: flagellin, partial [Syntrophorhabdus sp.]
TTRQDFTDKMIAILKVGGDNLTLADMNEEGANMLMLQTRQALGIQSLSMASQSAQQVLSLFR